MEKTRYQWAQWGDLNAFFGLMLDNVTNLVIFAGILVGVFGYPAEKVYSLMVPGTALGVLVGDLIYTWLAFQLAKKTGRTNVTAMPLGLDTPSTIGIAFAVLGPIYLETRDAILTWQVGMATLLLIGISKLIMSFFGDWVRRHVPQAGLLGSLAGVGIALLAFFPVMRIFSAPVVGLVSLGIILYALVARQRLPFGIPGAFLAVAAGTLIYYALGASELLGVHPATSRLELHLALPMPNLGFVHGLKRALAYLPIAFPFGLLTIVGGINVTESAHVAGDQYRTKDILLTEAVSTIVAALCGGVAQSTPYIGHPAYKAMGGRAAYTLATGLVVGIGGALGLISFFVEAIPEAAITPILLFVGIEIVSQAFIETSHKHTAAVVFAMVPVVGYLVLVHTDGVVGKLSPSLQLPESLTQEHDLLRAVGHGFILTAILWGGFLVKLIDGRLGHAALYMAICAALTLFGVIHSVSATGDVYLPWEVGSNLIWQMAIGYGALALLLSMAAWNRKSAAGPPLSPGMSDGKTDPGTVYSPR
jgi:AGZA family xanthine/uracil permease-like MFS transporter